ncbi:Dipeptidyl carboxypeptidase [Thalassocella blandensis]|nr:Dipeptidyl carboxypeptidase [Thalassocella blandensis]
MRNILLASAISATLAISGCSNDKPVDTAASADSPKTAKAMTPKTNALMRVSPLDYYTPEFDKVDTTLYEPALELGFTQHTSEIEKIANNPAAPTFDNTIIALEKSGELLNRAATVFFNLSGLISNDEYQRIESKMAPKFSEHNDNIYLNPALFKRVESLYQGRDKFTGEDKRLIGEYYKEFVRAGAKLDEDSKSKIREINTELSTLSTEFSQNLLASFKNDLIIVTDKSMLAGLSDDEISSLADAAKKADKQGYAITLVNTTRQPILGKLENRELRKKIWETSAYRAKDVNGPLLLKMTKLRAQKAKLLGYSDWASYVIADQMAKKPSEVFGILDDLAPKALEKAKAEAADIQAVIKAEGKNFNVAPWDWAYYAEKVRLAKYDMDENLIKPYFEMNTVIHDGLFFAMNKLYGITFKERNDLPVWHDDVMAFEVFNEDGSAVGLFYLDPYAREGKRGGAWMSSFVGQSKLKNTKPVVYNAQNIPKPAEGQPTLMTFDEVSTMFHEFGHAAHGLFSNVTYPFVAGTATARDFVEFPSQFNEDWMLDPAVLANYAKHYKTGEAIPQDLLSKLLKSRTFNQGYDTTEYLAAALLDMEWHSLSADAQITDAAKFEKEALARHGLDYAPVPPRYKSNFFAHVFAGGYSAGYYAYLWTEVLAADAFAYLQEQGGLTRENGDSYRNIILSRGNSRDLMDNYVEFRGQKPSTDALLVRRGLVTEKATKK